MYHQHEAHTVDTVLALPYFYQDLSLMTSRGEVINDNHLIRTVIPNGTIHTKIQPSMPTFTSEKIKGTTYTLTINGENTTCLPLMICHTNPQVPL